VAGGDIPDAPVVVRARWNAAATLSVPQTVLYGWQFRDESGGVCRASPRAFLHALVWCDHLDGAGLGHVCGPDPPHELVVCILPTDNTADTYARVAALGRSREAR